MAKKTVYKPTAKAKVLRPRVWLQIEGNRHMVALGGELVLRPGTDKERTVKEATQEQYKAAYEQGMTEYVKKEQVNVQAKQPDTESDKG